MGARHTPRALGWDFLVRSLRFCYLLWGGVFLVFSHLGRARLPAVFWKWPALGLFLSGPWGRGLLLGLGAAMSVAAFLELWELLGRLFDLFGREQDR